MEIRWNEKGLHRAPELATNTINNWWLNNMFAQQNNTNKNTEKISTVISPSKIRLCINHISWVNYNDLTATSLESWLIREIIPKWPQFRLVKYYNLPRYINQALWRSKPPVKSRDGISGSPKLHSWRNAPVSFLAMRRREISQELQDMDEKAS